MADESRLRLMNFVTEEELVEAKRTRGVRVDDGTAQRDKPLYEILKENKDKKDAEFNERFKHRPPKALDEDETEFLDKLEMSRKEYEQQLANEEAEQLQSFQEAVAAQSSVVYELKERPAAPKVEVSPSEQEPLERKKRQAHPLGGMIITVKPQAKKAKADASKTLNLVKQSNGGVDKPQVVSNGVLGGLVSYSDESEEDDS